jgi:hypothetical protein
MTAQQVSTDATTRNNDELIQWAKNEISKKAEQVSQNNRKRNWLNTIDSDILSQVEEQERSMSPPEKTTKLDIGKYA